MKDSETRARRLEGIAFRGLQATDDLEAITELLHEAYAPLAAAGMNFLASYQDAAVTKRRTERGDTFVALDGDRIVGIVTLDEASLTSGSPFYDRPDVAIFGQFAVRPSHQRRGIGSRLLELVEARAREKGVAELALNTSEHASDLIAMYRQMGYRFIETVKWEPLNYVSVIYSKSLR